MMGKVLSIIIPAYNVEKFIEKCINSISKQKINEELYEVIIVDDGSTDGTSRICRRLCEKNGKNIYFYSKQNGGLSDARNYGLSKASGKYVWFIDSDDYITDDSLGLIIDKLGEEKPDTLIIQSKKVLANGEISDECRYSIRAGVYGTDDYLGQLIKNPDSVIFCAQYHICRLDLIREKTILFKKGIIHEDELWTPQVLLNSKKILYLGIIAYYHVMRDGSIMHGTKIEKSGKSDICVADNLFEIYDLRKQLHLDYLYDRAVNIYLQAVWKVPKEVDDNIEKRLYLFKKSKLVKTKLKSFLYLLSPKLYIAIHKKTRE